MNALGARLYLPAKQFFKLANDAKVMAILVGGGASRLNGSNRFTKVCILLKEILSLPYFTHLS